ncbi:hypothetical protein [Salegentibacter maritimus]|uniref:DKNYY family protein n=1 Tax=Salegentibacter maritimus TaxID=2794347 RepID=A0ABS0TIY8_9FLAO|nr:hypothetical protein [Salegentibacter maritimus]MBI6121011.1 hypothetical protein [Salegentibacter maritimus]
MRKLLLIILSFLMFSCSDNEANKKDFLNYKWTLNNEIKIDKGNYHSYTSFDQKRGKMVGDSLIPIKTLDSSIIITQKVAFGKYDSNLNFIPNNDTLITDTLFFDIRDFKGKTKLLLFDENFYPIAYDLKSNEKLKENRKINNIPFKIAGLTIGDSIDRNEFEVKDVTNFENFSLESVEYIPNNDIDMEIIGDNFIHSIIQRKISSTDLEDIIKVVNSKLNMEAEHDPTEKNGDYESEYYRWGNNGVDITLQRMKYLGDDPWKKMASDNYWTLYYDDKVTQALLKSEFVGSKPKSTVIN